MQIKLSFTLLIAIFSVGQLYAADAKSNQQRQIDIIKTNFKTHSLHVQDIDGDGNVEIIVANRDKATIDIFRDKKNLKVDKKEMLNRNFIDYNENWKLESIPLDRDIYTLSIFDINGDKRDDLIYHGAPSGLMIRLQKEALKFSEPIAIDMPIAKNHKRSLAWRTIEEGTEIVTIHNGFRMHHLIDKKIKVVKKMKYTTLAENRGMFRSMFWGKHPGAFTEGLWMVMGNSTYPLVYFKNNGSLSYDYPTKIRIPKTRLLIPGNYNAKDVIDFAHIRQHGQLSEVSFERSQENRQKKYPLTQETFPLNVANSKSILSSVHDVNGDGDDDLIVVYRNEAKGELFLSLEGRLQPGKTFVTYKNIDILIPSKNGLWMVSNTDGLIGRSQFKDGILSFPKQETSKEKVISYLHHHKKEPGYASLTKNELGVFLKLDQKSYKVKLEEPYPKKGVVVQLSSAKTPELVLEVPYQGIVIYTWDENKKEYVEFSEQISFLKKNKLSDLNLGAIQMVENKDGRYDLTISEGKFINHYRFYPKPELLKKMDIARDIASSTFHLHVDLDGDKKNELVSYDRKNSKLDVFAAKENVDELSWVESHDLQLHGLDSLFALKLNAGDPQFLMGRLGSFLKAEVNGKAPWVGKLEPTGFQDADWQFTYGGKAIIFNDGEKDSLCLVDKNKNYFELYQVGEDNWKRRYSFPIFEFKSFARQNNPGFLREIQTAASKTDGKNNLYLLIHNRILIYDRS